MEPPDTAARLSALEAIQRTGGPLLKPALLLALLFRTMDAFRVFDLVFVMTQGGPGDATQVLQFYGYQTLFTEGRIGWGRMHWAAMMRLVEKAHPDFKD